MEFTVEHFHDLTQLLEEHPEWRAELRRLVLTDDILSLPQVVRDLADAQRRTEERLERLEAIVQDLAEAQRRTEERVDKLADQQRQMADTLADLKGSSLERDYRDKAPAYFGRLLRRARVVGWDAIEDAVESRLDDDEIHDVLLLDLVVGGRPRTESQLPKVWLAVEVSAVVDRHDVERAIRRARLLRKAGCLAIPAVAGEGVTEGGEESARGEKVLLLKDGGVAFWKQSLQAWTEE